MSIAVLALLWLMMPALTDWAVVPSKPVVVILCVLVVACPAIGEVFTKRQQQRNRR
ncbi:hypothetical protein [Streptomyces botrytidirepellens]|uniref:hypothetical protein n=1 Tax=Streptomyces botrytidirepellens TaxID=2486417 RepID=UPI00160B21BB|nr:hypothetical protein [Streptomyces botrytidirepellens]